MSGIVAAAEQLDPARLHEIGLPDPVPWVPQTWAWAVVLAAGLVLIAAAVVGARRRRAAEAYRRTALVELDAIERDLADPAARGAALTALPRLVKRTALAGFEREAVASLAGEEWLAFLDASQAGSSFTDGPGRLLADLAYRPPAAVSDPDLAALVGSVRSWIRSHRRAP